MLLSHDVVFTPPHSTSIHTVRPRGAKYDDYPSPLPPFLRYGDDHYRAATWRKVTVVEKIVDWGFNVMHSDVDVVWFRDPLPYFLGEPCKDIDVAISTGEVPGQQGRAGITSWGGGGIAWGRGGGRQGCM